MILFQITSLDYTRKNPAIRNFLVAGPLDALCFILSDFIKELYAKNDGKIVEAFILK